MLPGVWTSQRVSAMEKDIDRLETSLQLLIRIESRIAVIETEVKHINETVKVRGNWGETNCLIVLKMV